LASLTVDTNVDLVVDLHECVVAGGSGSRVDDPCAADRVRAAGLVDVATEDEVGLLALDERPDDGAADVLPARESATGVPLGGACGQKIVRRDRCDAC
jgi:hypothetical protein